jgi:hypothetical protein
MSSTMVFRPQYFSINDDFFQPRARCIDNGTTAQAFYDNGIIFGNVKLVQCSPCGNKPALEAGPPTQYGTMCLYWMFPISSATLYLCKSPNAQLPASAQIQCFRGGTNIYHIPLAAGCVKIHPNAVFDTIRIQTHNIVYLEGVSYELSCKG